MTPSQSVGPYFSIGLPFEAGPMVVPVHTPEAIQIGGTVYDGDGSAVPDNLAETWHADPDGRFADLHGHGGRSQPGWLPWARASRPEVGDGSFEIVSVKHGPVPGAGGKLPAPHTDVSAFARGMPNRRARSALTLALVCTLGHEEELVLRIRAALRNGLTAPKIAEVLHTGVRAGVPAANSASKRVQSVLPEEVAL